MKNGKEGGERCPAPTAAARDLNGHSPIAVLGDGPESCDRRCVPGTRNPLRGSHSPHAVYRPSSSQPHQNGADVGAGHRSPPSSRAPLPAHRIEEHFVGGNEMISHRPDSAE